MPLILQMGGQDDISEPLAGFHPNGGALYTCNKTCWENIIQGGATCPSRVKWVLAGRWTGQSGLPLLLLHPWKTVPLNQPGVAGVDKRLSQMCWGRGRADGTMEVMGRWFPSDISYDAMESRAIQAMNTIPRLPLTSYMTRANCFLSLDPVPSSVSLGGRSHSFTQQILFE